MYSVFQIFSFPITLTIFIETLPRSILYTIQLFYICILFNIYLSSSKTKKIFFFLGLDTKYVDKINYVANWNKITLVMSIGHQIGIPLEKITKLYSFWMMLQSFLLKLGLERWKEELLLVMP